MSYSIERKLTISLNSRERPQLTDSIKYFQDQPTPTPHGPGSVFLPPIDKSLIDIMIGLAILCVMIIFVGVWINRG